LLALIFGTAALAADMRGAETVDNKHTVVILSGDITEGDSKTLKNLIIQAALKERPVSGIILESPGGQLREGVKLAEIIRTARIKASVAVQCASACFLAFAGGLTNRGSPNRSSRRVRC
jgi:hypothetical protein